MSSATQSFDSWTSTWSFYRNWPVRRRWLRFFTLASLVVMVMAIRQGYLANHRTTFFGGIALAVAVAAAWLRAETRLVSRIGWPVWQRAAAACLALALVESGYHAGDRIATPQGSKHGSELLPQVVTYAEAQGDAHAFAKWWQAYTSEWHRHANLIEIRETNGPVPYRLRPNSSRPFFRGQIAVNSLGLCDREVSREKPKRYRIVVMGSSHTQCPPIEAGDETWPAKLERCIHERLPAGCDVEVLNAGAAGYTIEHNLHRLQEVVLPLKPDMIITYFGYNEFSRFREDFRLPAIPPQPRSRPSTLVGHVEWRFSQWLAKQGPQAEPLTETAALRPRLQNCGLAQVYREYQRLAQQHGVKLVVCNFCMAVNERSPQTAVNFYAQGFPDVHYMIAANRLNSALLPEVFSQSADCRSIDVQENLDGEWEHDYLDLVHLSEVGKKQLAENVYRGISDLLQTSLPSETSPQPSRIAVQRETDDRPL